MIKIPSDLALDEHQHAVIKKLDVVIDGLLKNRGIYKFFNKTKFKGLYIYGSVGTGKTMISKLFYDNFPNAIYQHYQEFMKHVHLCLNKSKGESKHLVLKKIAAELASKHKVLVIDEFEVKDIADAMLIGKLFIEICEQNSFIMLTSNTKPEDLYKDGLQRDSFMYFIKYLKENFEILNIQSTKDYRLAKLSNRPKILYPSNVANEVIMGDMIKELIGNRHILSQKAIQVFGRKVKFNTTYDSIVISSFEELCGDNLSYNDYIEVCKHFKVIVIKSVPIMDDDMINEVIRFINLIDNIYFYRIKLFMTMATDPSSLYSGKKRQNEFRRTVSRITEMQSDNY